MLESILEDIAQSTASFNVAGLNNKLHITIIA